MLLMKADQGEVRLFDKVADYIPEFAAAGKRSITINLAEPDGQALARKLVETADVVQHNMGEGAMKKLQELRKQTLAKAESKLNDEQQKSWKEALGARSRSGW